MTRKETTLYLSGLTEKMINATKLVKEKAKSLIVDGELQLDAAIVPEIAKSKACFYFHKVENSIQSWSILSEWK